MGGGNTVVVSESTRQAQSDSLTSFRQTHLGANTLVASERRRQAQSDSLSSLGRAVHGPVLWVELPTYNVSGVAAAVDDDNNAWHDGGRVNEGIDRLTPTWFAE